MGYREELIELVKEWTEDSIDITDDWNEWEEFLTQQGYIKTYKEVYEMDLSHLQSFGHDFDNTEDYINDDGTWNVEQLISEDNDIVKMSNECYFVHNQDYIDEYTIDKFYEQQAEKQKQKMLELKITQAYMDLKLANNGYNRLEYLLTIFKHNFGKESIYLLTSQDKTKKEFVKCMNEVLEIRNHFGEDYGYFHTIIFENTASDEEDEKYMKVLKHIGYDAFCQNAENILESDFVILENYDGNQDVQWFTYENIEDFVNYIEDVVLLIRKEVIAIGDKEFEIKVHQKLEEIIDNYWMNTIEFDYAEFFSNI